MVMRDVKPLVDLFVNMMVMSAYLLWSGVLLFCFYLLDLICTSVAVPYSSVPHMNNTFYPIRRLKRATTSADSNAPMMLPRWGTLLTYGRAEVISVFLLVGVGRTLGEGRGICCDLKVLRDWSCYGVRETLTGVSFFFFVENSLKDDFNSLI